MEMFLVTKFIRLNEIELRNKKIQLETADIMVSLCKRLSEITADTPTEQLKELQEQIRAMLNKTESDLEVIKEDRRFVTEIFNRDKDDTQ